MPIADLLPAGADRVFNVQEAIDKALANAKSLIRFRSFGGRWIGTDCDADIELRPGMAVVLAEYGITDRSYNGTYSITDTAELKLSLPKYGDEWPAMQMYRDKADLLLVPTDPSTGFIFGHRGGATIPGGQGSFWPFRQIPENE